MKTKIALVLSLSLLACLLMQSCTSGPLEGDWFPCKDEACTRLDDDGIRFTADNRWATLDAPGSTFEPGEPYELDGPRGDYTFDGTHLTVTMDGEPEVQTIRVDFADNGDLLLHVKSSSDVACAQPQGEPVKCTPPDPEEEIKVIRFKRAGDAMTVPVEPREKKNGTQPVPVPPPVDPGV